jgi:hypothetical protein
MDRSALLITILLSLACGIAANLGTPLLKTLYLKGLFTTKKALIRRIEREIELTDFYLNNPTTLNLYLFKEMFRLIQWILTGTLVLHISTLLQSPNATRWAFRLGGMIIGFTLGRASGVASFAQSLLNSENFKKKLLAELAILESKKPTQTSDGQ